MGKLGYPKYKLDDIVSFECDGKTLSGKVAIVDAYGTFGQNEEPSYDIMVEEGQPWTLYKHIRESWILNDNE
ncbi:hypothetical protein SAMN02910292_02978 [Lachnospiraceae bacterium XBB2008]|nr:hypothetical protein SAMN02910292_02978 [Lachnospiraceae bacterium XBB2008]